MTTKELPQPLAFGPTLGCDPEFFFTNKGKKIVGAENIIPKEGLQATLDSKVIIDGVQAELNPRPASCRQLLANEIAVCFKALNKQLKAQKFEGSVNFSQSVKIGKRELAKLDKENQKFGCAPSLTSYSSEAGVNLEAIDATKHLQRSAGGHIHLGSLVGPVQWTRAINQHPEKIIRMMDIIVGNTCVLIDRDRGNVERRKFYGRAGEYRLPKHGIEYRVLSNFWLRHADLSSLVFGLARLVAQLMGSEKHWETYYKAFTEAVEEEDVVNAINRNNLTLARKNWKAIQPLLLQVAQIEGHHPVNAQNIKEFEYFVYMVQKHGLEYWFKKDPLEHWTEDSNFGRGFDTGFLQSEVKSDMESLRKKLFA